MEKKKKKKKKNQSGCGVATSIPEWLNCHSAVTKQLVVSFTVKLITAVAAGLKPKGSWHYWDGKELLEISVSLCAWFKLWSVSWMLVSSSLLVNLVVWGLRRRVRKQRTSAGFIRRPSDLTASRKIETRFMGQGSSTYRNNWDVGGLEIKSQLLLMSPHSGYSFILPPHFLLGFFNSSKFH